MIPNNPPTIYLAGAIRDDHPEDIEWREWAMARLNGLAVFLNPLASKRQDNGEWTSSGIIPDGKFLVKHDFWCVRHADIILANLSSLSQGYNSIGTLMELGHASAFQEKLIYTVLDPGFKGHTNLRMYTLHPFLEQVSAQKFFTVLDAINFLNLHLRVLSGSNPHYGGRP